jgi:hypothetical protein
MDGNWFHEEARRVLNDEYFGCSKLKLGDEILKQWAKVNLLHLFRAGRKLSIHD